MALLRGRSVFLIVALHISLNFFIRGAICTEENWTDNHHNDLEYVEEGAAEPDLEYAEEFEDGDFDPDPEEAGGGNMHENGTMILMREYPCKTPSDYYPYCVHLLPRTPPMEDEEKPETRSGHSRRRRRRRRHGGGDSKPRCGSYNGKHYRGFGGCFILRDGKMLTVKLKNGKLDIPCGHNNRGEPAHCTAQRETWEESGYYTNPGSILSTDGHFHVYKCEITGKSRPGTPWEVIGNVWLTYDQIERQRFRHGRGQGRYFKHLWRKARR